MIDVVSETYRTSWDRVTELPVVEFLNVFSYRIATDRYIKDQMDREYARMKKR